MKFALFAAAALVASATGLVHKEQSALAMDTTLDINQKAYVEGVPVVGEGAGEASIGQCSKFARSAVTDKSKPSVKVCGTRIRMTVFLAGRCDTEGHSAHFFDARQWTVGSCDTKQDASSCQEFSPAQDERMGHAQSYRVDICATGAAR